MNHKQFEYGPMARGIFHACIALTILVPLLSMEMPGWWVLMLIFLGVGLRPPLERTGLYRLFSHYLVVMAETPRARFVEERRQEIDRKLRDKKFRGRHRQHKYLPKNWCGKWPTTFEPSMAEAEATIAIIGGVRLGADERGQAKYYPCLTFKSLRQIPPLN